MVAPGVLLLSALLLGTDGFLPTVGVPEAVAAAVNHTAAGETEEFGMKSFERFSQVLAQAMTLVGVLWHQRDLVDIHHAEGEDQYAQRSVSAVGLCLQGAGVGVPLVAVNGEDGVGDDLFFLSGFNE